MQIKQFDIWIADLNPQIGTEPGKTRPVVIMQTDLLNNKPHPSTVICPITTNIESESKILRVGISKLNSELIQDSDIMMDQIRVIDNKRLVRKIGRLPEELIGKVKDNLKIILDL